MTNRRSLLATGLGAGASLAFATAATAGTRASETKHKIIVVDDTGLKPDATLDQTSVLQAAIDTAALRGAPLHLPAGTFRVGTLTLRPGSRLVGEAAATTLEFLGGASCISAEDAPGIAIQDLVIDGAGRPFDSGTSAALVELRRCDGVIVRNVAITRSAASGLALEGCSGRIADCTISHVAETGLRSLDGEGIAITHNTVRDCANNGIQVWRSSPGDDGTTVSSNRIERISAAAGGSGENGNGVNVFRAGGVLVTANRITDCTYSAIRGNAASNIQIVANSCARIGEVALYAEFGFEGALIASNVVERAASGIAVTNYNEGGRLAVVQGNLVRTLTRREHEPVDKRGVGISVEADSVVSGNTIEGAETVGIIVGWGPWMRDCLVSQNLVRGAPVGILVSDDETAGSVLVSGNMISGTRNGAIRAMREGEPIGPDLVNDAGRKGRTTITANIAGVVQAPPRPLSPG